MFDNDLTPAETINGLGEVELEALMGSQPKSLAKVMKTVAAQATAGAGKSNSRQEFLKRMTKLDSAIAGQITGGKMRLADRVFYVTKNVANVNRIKMMVDDDKKVIGVNNISQGKLEKDNVFLLHAIRVTSAVCAANDVCGDFAGDIIPARLRNGQFLLKANGSEIIPISSNEVFDTTNENCKKGLFVLDNPVLIQTQKEIEFEMEWTTAAADKTWIRLQLIGTQAYKK